MKNRVEILDETVCILHSANTHRKDMHLTILPPDMGKLWNRLGSLTLE